MKSLFPRTVLGFSLLELLAAVTIISVLAALVFPLTVRFRDKARETKCAANLRAISGAVGMWSSDNDGKLPNSMDAADGWKKRLAPYLGVVIQPGSPEPGSPEAPVTVFTCPAVKEDQTANKRSYGFNSKLHDSTGGTDDPVMALANKSGTILVADCFATSWLQAQGNLSFRHKSRANALFCDGHVESLNLVDVNRIGQSKLIEGKY